LSVPTTLRLTRSTLVSAPLNSQVKNAKRPSIEKSAWLMPPQSGVSIEYFSAIVFGSRKSRRLWASATTIADCPSGDQYMLYGSSTGIAAPGLPVSGSIGVRLPVARFSALFATQSVRRSHAGTTCCGFRPTGKVAITFSVAGSITDTLLAAWLGT